MRKVDKYCCQLQKLQKALYANADSQALLHTGLDFKPKGAVSFTLQLVTVVTCAGWVGLVWVWVWVLVAAPYP